MELSWFKKIKNKIKAMFHKEDNVPQGIQVFDKNGEIVIDVTDRLTQVVGIYTIPRTSSEGSITVPNIGNNKVWFATNIQNAYMVPYLIWINNNIIRYKINTQNGDNPLSDLPYNSVINLIYGVC